MKINYKVDNLNCFYDGTSIYIVNKNENTWLCKARNKFNKPIIDIDLLIKITNERLNEPIIF